jgi:hypothetical protein
MREDAEVGKPAAHLQCVPPQGHRAVRPIPLPLSVRLYPYRYVRPETLPYLGNIIGSLPFLCSVLCWKRWRLWFARWTGPLPTGVQEAEGATLPPARFPFLWTSHSLALSGALLAASLRVYPY